MRLDPRSLPPLGENLKVEGDANASSKLEVLDKAYALLVPIASGYLNTSKDPSVLYSSKLLFENDKKFKKPVGVDESNWKQQSIATKIKYAQWEDPIYGNLIDKMDRGILGARTMNNSVASFNSDPYMVYTSQYLSKKVPEWIGSLGSSTIWSKIANYFSGTKNPYHPR